MTVFALAAPVVYMYMYTGVYYYKPTIIQGSSTVVVMDKLYLYIAVLCHSGRQKRSVSAKFTWQAVFL